MYGGKSSATADEVIAHLRNSRLPTLITEGRDDYLIFRRLERTLKEGAIDVLPVGSKSSVLEIYHRRGELGDKRVCFIVDRDHWVFSKPPEGCDDLIITDGYSIENDVFRDGPVEELMNKDELRDFLMELDSYIELYALLVSRYLKDGNSRIAVSPHEYFSSDERRTELLDLAPGEVYPDQLRQICRDEYGRLVRGKTLIELALRQLSKSSRPAKFSRHALLEQCVVRWGPLMTALKSRIESEFAKVVA